jgi:EAL domain-containing protein (putative c-di-GMP-specific phosphodiesterase class I)
MSVNVSTRMFQESDLVSRIHEAIQTHGIEPNRLTLEITESALMSDPEQALARVKQLRALGIEISIDDFGTGYSSLSYLKRLPINEIKVDKTFVFAVHEGGTSASDLAIIQAVIAMAKPLQAKVVAEGVENREVCVILNELGCDILQGYYFSCPLPADALERLIQRAPWGIPLEETPSAA